MNGRHHGDIHIAGGTAEKLRGLLLAAGRNRIDVEEIRIAAQMRGDRFCGLKTRCGSHGGNHNIGLTNGIGGRVGDPDADLARGLFQSGAVRLRKQDVPCADLRHTLIAQAGSDRLAGLAEPDEAEAGRTRIHGSLLSFL